LNLTEKAADEVTVWILLKVQGQLMDLKKFFSKMELAEVRAFQMEFPFNFLYSFLKFNHSFFLLSLLEGRVTMTSYSWETFFAS